MAPMGMASAAAAAMLMLQLALVMLGGATAARVSQSAELGRMQSLGGDAATHIAMGTALRIQESQQQLQQQQQQEGRMRAGTRLDDGDAAGIQLVTRQSLFDYASDQGLQLLKQRVQDISIPDQHKSFRVPVIGEFIVSLTGIKVEEFNVPEDGAALTILDSFFNLSVNSVFCRLSFHWHWERPGIGLHGSGDGELVLEKGMLNYVFALAKDGATMAPRLDVRDANSYFESAELSIHSSSADWLYQAVMQLFNDRHGANVEESG